MGAMFQPTRRGAAYDLPLRGYHAVYRLNVVNHCPGCGRTHWLVGRTLAECGFCATALPLAGSEAARDWGAGYR
jgi:hypothetical protein